MNVSVTSLMSWIESHQSLLNHPKLFKLCGAMEWEKYEGVGRLHAFWYWCMEYALDGDLTKFNDAQIALGMGVAIQQARRLVKAMVESCWIDREPYMRVHDWWDYVGLYLMRRYASHPELWKRVKETYRGKNHKVTSGGVQSSVQKEYPTVPYQYQTDLSTKIDLSTDPNSGTCAPTPEAPEAPPEPRKEPRKRRMVVFEPPTLEQLKARFKELEKPGEPPVPDAQAEQFLAYYSSNGWKVGRNPMKSWEQAAVRWKLVWLERNGHLLKAAARGPVKLSGPEVIVLQKELDRVLQEMRDIKNSYSEHQNWNQPDREAYQKLRVQRNELRERLGLPPPVPKKAPQPQPQPPPSTG